MKTLNKARINVMVLDMEHALKFYVEDLEFELLNRYGNHYAELNARGLIIGLHPKSPKVTMGNNISIGLGVFDFDDTIKNFESKGIRFIREDDGYIRLAYFSDPDGNSLFLAENK